MSVVVALNVFAHAAVAANEVQAGAGRAAFVLPKGVPLAGYSKRQGRPSRGIHDAVGARAMVLRDGDAIVALVSCDLLIVDEHLFDAVRRRLLAEGMPQAFVLILAGTHTHSGPGAYGTRFLEKISMGHFDPRVFDAIVQSISQAVLRARAGLSPVRFTVLTTRTEGLVKNRVDPRGLTDPELAVAAFYREAEETPFAVLVNFAAHPTALGPWNRYVSADYPGVVTEMMERRFPGSTCLFFSGSVGDQAPAKAGIGFERSAWIGASLAQQVVALVEAAHPVPPTVLHAAQEEIALPPARVRLSPMLTLPRWIGQRLVDDDATLSVLTVGNAVLFGVPCDLTAELGQQLKAAARARGLEPMIIGFASDYIGYCVSRAFYERNRYETLMAFNGPTTGTLIVRQLIQMLDQLGER